MSGHSKTALESYPAQPSASAKDDAIAFYKQVTSVTASCDFAGGSRAIAILGGDPVAVYQAARKEDTACLSMNNKLADLQIPQSLGRPVATAFSKAIESCESYYLYEWSAAHSLEIALDNGKVADFATYRETQTVMMAESLKCSNELKSAANPLGVKDGDLNANGNPSAAHN